MKPWLLPSGLQRGLPFIIRDDWPPEQALAVIELLDDLREVIWNRYHLQLQEYLSNDCSPSSFNSAFDESEPF